MISLAKYTLQSDCLYCKFLVYVIMIAAITIAITISISITIAIAITITFAFYYNIELVSCNVIAFIYADSGA
jgi:hypothetical protein